MKVTINNAKMVIDRETFVPHKVIDATIELSIELLTEAKVLGKGELFQVYCEGLVKMILEKAQEFEKHKTDDLTEKWEGILDEDSKSGKDRQVKIIESKETPCGVFNNDATDSTQIKAEQILKELGLCLVTRND